MIKPQPKSHGRLLAEFLGGAWRESPPETSVSAEELAELAPMLMGSGAGALAWWRIRESSLSASPTGAELHEAYRLHTLHALLFKQRIKQAFQTLRAAAVEPILIKGWANARLYPEPGLRPYGDLDLCVHPDDFETAYDLLMNNEEGRQCVADLHKGLDRLDDRGWEVFYGRSRVVHLDDVEVRLLAPEDHLRVLCVHMLEAGAWRPIQLCDIAAAVEAADSSFDWDLCLGRDKRRAGWVTSAIGLAQRLLGASVENCPAEVREARVPGWLVPTVLRHWERPRIDDHPLPESFLKTLRHPIRLPKALLMRWPDPIGATVRMKAPFNSLPRLPFQVGDYFRITGKFLTRLPKLVRGRH